MVARLVSGTAVLAMATLAWPAAAVAAPGDGPLGLEVRPAPASRSDQVRLTLTVTNNSTQPCGLSKVAEGTVAIVAVRRDGTALQPVLGRSFYLDGIGSAIEAGLTETKPTENAQVVLAAIRVHDDADADAVTPSCCAR
jgi:hypothetical protein